MGRLIPAGTGMEYYRNVRVDRDDARDGNDDAELPENFASVVDAVDGDAVTTRVSARAGANETTGD